MKRVNAQLKSGVKGQRTDYPYDGSICQPAILLQGSHLPKEEADESKNKTANCVAELELCDLRQSLAITNNDKTNVE